MLGGSSKLGLFNAASASFMRSLLGSSDASRGRGEGLLAGDVSSSSAGGGTFLSVLRFFASFAAGAAFLPFFFDEAFSSSRG